MMGPRSPHARVEAVVVAVLLLFVALVDVCSAFGLSTTKLAVQTGNRRSRCVVGSPGKGRGAVNARGGRIAVAAATAAGATVAGAGAGEESPAAAIAADDGGVPLGTGHVDMASLQDLVTSGTLTIIKRRPDYIDKRGSDYEEPLEIFLVGTSHVAEQSGEDVRRVIEATRPESVVVELCRSRVGMMMPLPDAPVDEESGDGGGMNSLSMSGSSFTEDVRRSVELGGVTTTLARVAMAKALQGVEVGKAGGAPPGVDFRAAWSGAMDIGAEVVLGDRPIEITLRRAWSNLPFAEKLKLLKVCLSLLIGGGKGTAGTTTEAEDRRREALEAAVTARGGDMMDKMAEYLQDEFPSLVEPLVKERDLYLTLTIKRSKAVNGKKRVVAVVGRGHVKGLTHILNTDNGGQSLPTSKELTYVKGVDRQKRRRQRQAESKASLTKKGLLLLTRVVAETWASFWLWDLYQQFMAQSSAV